MTISKRCSLVILLALSCLLFTGVAQAAFTTGDVFAGVGSGRIFRYSPTGTLLQTLTTGFPNSEDTGMAFDASGNLYATNFQGAGIAKFDTNGTKVGNFGSGFNSDPESIVFDQAGNAYVGQADGTRNILKFDAAGALLQSFAPTTGPRGTDWIDLSSDQHTIFYTSEGGNIRRFDVATNTQLPDFANVSGTSFALRLLPGGGLLVAHTNNVLRLDASGNIVQTYLPSNAGTLFALNLDPDGTSFWTAGLSSTTIYRVDIATGNVITSWNASKDGASEVAGLAVFGEITIGGPGPGTGGATPEPATMAIMAGGLGVLVLVRRRRKV